MYGQIHCVIRELVQTKFGNEAWETVLRKSQLDEHDSFLVFTRYDDVSTFSLVKAVSDTLEVPVETVLEIFGEFFFDYCLRHGYDKMLRTLGSDIKSFIQNLDSLHSLLALSYKGISAPSFRCEDGEDGVLLLHYYSGRPGLYPIVKGVVKAVARVLFDQSVEMTIIEQNEEDIGCNQSQEHTAFRVLLRTECRTTPTSEISNNVIRELTEFKPEKVLLNVTDFCSAFPYHIIFDRELQIRQCGDLVQKHSSIAITEGLSLTKAFNIVHPKMVVSIDNIRKFINAVFLMAISPSDNGKKTFLLKGQMIWLEETQNMIFIGSPRLTSLNELMEMNVYLADIPLYDVTRELVLLNQQRIAEIDIAKRLDETTAELKRTSQALEQEKSKTETLLHQMLPRKVATALTNGQRVEAEKFDPVTILFSDIVTFTNIASACSPMDIVNMLNDMYQRFDGITSKHNVYKVETIGDAYMVVSGVPEKTSIHGPPVANFAMDMVENAGLVRSPATGLPLQIRVGVHTGPVVAGVVGVKMPRYCLFGDTVNTASRMESHGVPGRIHLSPTAHQALLGWGYAFKHRGQMEVKGKGVMSTYFLCGHLDRTLTEPQDDFTGLDLICDSSENGDFLESPELTRDDPHHKTKMEDTDTHVSSHITSQNLHDFEDPGGGTGQNDSRDDTNQVNKAISLDHFNCGSSHSLVSLESQKRVARKIRISRSSNDSFQRSIDIPVQNDTSNLNSFSPTAVVKTTNSIQTSSRETDYVADCVYISGSFKNEYRGGNSRENSDVSESRFLRSEDIHNPQHETQFDPSHIIPDVSREITHAQTKIRQRSKRDNRDITNLSVAMPTVSDGSKHGCLTLSPTFAVSPLQYNSISKSETFPLPSCNLHHSTCPPSCSHGNLATLKTDTKLKKGKKHRSKLCIVA